MLRARTAEYRQKQLEEVAYGKAPPSQRNSHGNLVKLRLGSGSKS